MWQLRPFKNASCVLRNSALRPANDFEKKPHVLDEKMASFINFDEKKSDFLLTLI